MRLRGFREPGINLPRGVGRTSLGGLLRKLQFLKVLFLGAELDLGGLRRILIKGPRVGVDLGDG